MLPAFNQVLLEITPEGAITNQAECRASSLAETEAKGDTVQFKSAVTKWKEK